MNEDIIKTPDSGTDAPETESPEFGADTEEERPWQDTDELTPEEAEEIKNKFKPIDLTGGEHMNTTLYYSIWKNDGMPNIPHSAESLMHDVTTEFIERHKGENINDYLDMDKFNEKNALSLHEDFMLMLSRRFTDAQNMCRDQKCELEYKLKEAAKDPKKALTPIQKDEIKSKIAQFASIASAIGKCPTNMPGWCAARIVTNTGDIKVLKPSGNTKTGGRIIAKNYYKEDGEWKWSGTWTVQDTRGNDPSCITERLFRAFCPGASKGEHDKYTQALFDAEEVTAWSNKKLVFFRNGVFNFEDKSFTGYSDPAFDQRYKDCVALNKLPVNHPLGKGAVLEAPYNMPVIHNEEDGTDWTPDGQIRDLFDDTPEGAANYELVWEAVQCLITHRNPEPHLYFLWLDVHNGNGHNGKGTLWAMMRRLLVKPTEECDRDLSGGKSVIPLALDELDNDYAMGSGILSAYAIVGEEMSGTTPFVSGRCCAIAKNMCRNQEMSFREIYGSPFSVQPDLFLMSQSNGMPVFSDKSPSMLSHFAILYFGKSFTDARSYIKDDYVLREDVAEWIVWHATMEMDYVEKYSEAALAQNAERQAEVLERSSNVRQFLRDALPGLYFNFMPLQLLYDLYCGWCEKNGITGGQRLRSEDFGSDLKMIAMSNEGAVFGVSWCEKPHRLFRQDIFNEDNEEIHNAPNNVSYPRFHPAIKEFGYTKQRGATSFSNGVEGVSVVGTGCANVSLAGKVFYRGGLIRNTRWQDDPKMQKDRDGDIPDEFAPEG